MRYFGERKKITRNAKGDVRLWVRSFFFFFCLGAPPPMEMRETDMSIVVVRALVRSKLVDSLLCIAPKSRLKCTCVCPLRDVASTPLKG